MPAFDVCSEMLDILLETKTSQAAAELGLEGHGGKERAWVAPLADNRRKWKEQCQSSTRGNDDVILTGLKIEVRNWRYSLLPTQRPKKLICIAWVETYNG